MARTQRTISAKPKVCFLLEQGTQFGWPASLSQRLFSICDTKSSGGMIPLEWRSFSQFFTMSQKSPP
jgi:hypothetical protein